MPFRLPKVCDSCVHHYVNNPWDSGTERCSVFPEGIPLEIQYMGASDEENYQMREGDEDVLHGWLLFWSTPDDNGDLEDGASGILPAELDSGDAG